MNETNPEEIKKEEKIPPVLLSMEELSEHAAGLLSKPPVYETVAGAPIKEVKVKICGRCSKPKKHENEKDRCHCGRPMTYSIKMVEKAQEYIDECEDEEEEVMSGVTARGTELYKKRLRVKLPSIEGLALHLEITRSTVYEWIKEYKEFSDIIELLLAKQANVLLNKGISGEYNSVISKVILTKHGYREGIENTGKDGKDLFIIDEEKKTKSDEAIREVLSGKHTD